MAADTIHNRNCYDYLLQLIPHINKQMMQRILELNSLQSIMAQCYNPSIPYGDLYSLCISALEEYIDKNPNTTLFNELIFALYHNNNRILEQDTDWLKHTSQNVSPRVPAGKEIKRFIRGDAKKINHPSPYEKGHFLNKLSSLFAPNFKPQHKTNIPSIKNYAYKEISAPTEYRFCTQGQRHQGSVRVSPLFEKWLALSAEYHPDQQINHIYFNNLALDKRYLNVAARKERSPALALHQLEKKPHLKVLVITLPANEGLMHRSACKKTNKSLSIHSVFQELLDVAKGKPHPSGITDFNISPKVRKLLFSSPQQEEEKLTELLKNSFKAHGIHIEQAHFISPAQKQAVWLHFVKYELTHYIIQTIQPNSYNFSCKSAIDRGALSSIYYNLHQSFAVNEPMGRNEFERSIDVAAVNTSGRGMNFHRKILWNALDSYVHANHNELFRDPRKSWLIYWRDMNCPYSRVDELISLRLNEVTQQLYELPCENALIKTSGLHLLSAVKQLSTQAMRDKPLLLEVISRTSLLIQNPSKQSIAAYKNLSLELQTKQPSLTVISGLMELLLGLILYLPSLGHSKQMIRHGCTHSGFFTLKRLQLSQHMEQLAEPVALMT